MKKKSLIHLFSILTLTLLISSCDIQEKTPEIQGKQWVYVELITQSKKDTSDYFYYGQIKKSVLERINTDSSAEGLFVLSSVRFTNDDQELELYENDKVGSTLMFRIQDIEEITFYKDDPVYLFEMDELHESAKKLRNRTNRQQSSE